MKMINFHLALVLSASVVGCVQKPPANESASDIVQQVLPGADAAAKRTMITSNSVTASDFNKMDDKKKKETADTLIDGVHGRRCIVSKITLSGRFMGEPNSWHVSCQESKLDYDYSLILPAPRAPNGQVLPCFRSQSGSMGCSVFARPGA